MPTEPTDPWQSFFQEIRRLATLLDAQEAEAVEQTLTPNTK